MSRISRCLMLCVLVVFAVLSATFVLALATPVTAHASSIEHTSPSAAALRAGDIRQFSQKENESNEDAPQAGVSPEQLQKYVAVYRAMQRNHGLTIKQAAASQGLTVPAFRDLERRVESDDLARDDARRALATPGGQAASQPRD